MNNKNAVATRLILPTFSLTETCEPTNPGAKFREVSYGKGKTQGYYYKLLSEPFTRTNYRERYQWNQYPVMINDDGSPWIEANLYLRNYSAHSAMISHIRSHPFS